MTVPPLATIRRVLAEHWHANWSLAATVDAVGCEADRRLYTAFGLTDRPAPPRRRTDPAAKPKRRRPAR